MSALSFVALSLQTTHLDPATVSKASYVKLVGGNITRLDSIQILPPTTADAASRSAEPTVIAWPEALTKLSMMIGKLPIISYYRDADKEIFQAASRQVGQTPAAFPWLDCRALARKVLPELPEYQLSTVLKALGLFDEYADRSMVEQTAQIVLTLAEQQQANTLKELWGDLYDLPDDLLDLEGIFDGAAPEPIESAITIEVHAAHGGLADPVLDMTAQHLSSHETHEISRERFDNVPATAVQHDLDEDEQPEFLKVPDQSELLDHAGQENDRVPAEPLDEPELTEAHTPIAPAEALAAPSDQAPSEVTGEVALVVTGDLAADVVVDDVPTTVAPAGPVDADQPTSVADVDDSAADVESPAKLQPATSHTPQAPQGTLEDHALPSTDAPADSDLQPAQPNVGGPTLEASDDAKIALLTSATESSSDAPSRRRQVPVAPVLIPPSAPPAEPMRRRRANRKSKSAAARIFGLLGLGFFGALSLIGAVVTVMAIMLFFTSNTLMFEIKLAGVILTGAVTLLSLLLVLMSYRSMRRTRV